MNLCDEKVLLCYGVQYYFTLEILYNYLCEETNIYTHIYIYIYYVIDVTLITLLSFQFVCFL